MRKQPRNSNRPAIYAGKAHAEKYAYDTEASFVWKKPVNRETKKATSR